MAKKSSVISQPVTNVSTEDKLRAIEAARLQIEKQFGQGSLMKLGSRTNAAGIETIPSGSILLDEALGLGGYPKGRVVEIYGPESSGKTTLALHAIAESQKRGGIAAFIDAEHALDPLYARSLGVNIDELYVSQPDTGEQALEIAESLVRSGAVEVIVVDSVAALTPQAEIDGDMGDSHVGLQARLMSQALRKLTGTISKSGTCLIFINQIRMKIGVMFGNPETTTGGKALKFYSSVRLEVRRIETITQGADNAIGNKVRVKVVKNKIAPPFKKVEMEIMFGKGISASGSLLDAALRYEVIQKSGSWYSYGDERIGQGRENAKLFLEANPETALGLDRQLRAKMFAHLAPADPTTAATDGKGSATPTPGSTRPAPAATGAAAAPAPSRGAAPAAPASRVPASISGADDDSTGDDNYGDDDYGEKEGGSDELF